MVGREAVSQRIIRNPNEKPMPRTKVRRPFSQWPYYFVRVIILSRYVCCTRFDYRVNVFFFFCIVSFYVATHRNNKTPILPSAQLRIDNVKIVLHGFIVYRRNHVWKSSKRSSSKRTVIGELEKKLKVFGHVQT